ncbi:glycosyltransferase family 4 protein [Algoriphagus aquimarinus]|uniref:Glycosyltransferase family 4 protein n=1 Tax=Algoriphagus aquimarinus TaxID=237018 RepID=A0A5C7A932_9BACT|nr:glycosyltransferase family 4 protein [Algoriphagus aquimarinus]TXE02413.1 glycosyltransferase family 4 protein [Algoriphagus aquimarinus]
MNKIAFLTSEFITPDQAKTGGLGTYLWNQAKLLSEKGIVVVIYQPSFRDSEVFYFGKKVLFKEFKLTPFKPSIFQIALHFFIKRIKKYSLVHYLKLKSNAQKINSFLESELRNNPVDLIQFVNLNGLGYYPVLTTPSIIRISSLTNLYNQFGRGYYGLRSEIIQAQIKIEEETYKNAICIVGPSTFSLNQIKPNPFQLKLRLPTPIGIQVDSRRNKKLDQTLKIGYFGNIDYRKGVDLLIDAILRLKLDTCHLFLCGRLNVDNEENIKIKDQVLSESFIHYSDSLPKGDLFELMKEMDLIILPSRVDNCPNTLLESLAMGKIVIGPNAWGFEEVITNGVNGILFESGSLSSLVDAIDYFMNLSVEKRMEIEENAFLSVQEYLGSRLGDKIVNIYKQCIDHYNIVCAES